MAVMVEGVYRDARHRLAGLVAELTQLQLQVPVPATPAWTVHELVAHLVGGAADVASGRLDGAPGAGWTARHVGERKGQPVGELLAAWERVGPVVERGLAGEAPRGPNLAWDLLCHEGDLHEALGLARPDRQHWQAALETTMGLVGRRLRQPGTLVICDEQGQQWVCGLGEPSTLLTADGYELLRGAFSRRSQQQIAAWNWSPAPPKLLRRFGLLGAYQDDQPLPVDGRTNPAS